MTEVLFWCKATKTKSLRDGNNVFESKMKKMVQRCYKT